MSAPASPLRTQAACIPDREPDPAANITALLDSIARLEKRLAALEELTRPRRHPSRDLHIDY